MHSLSKSRAAKLWIVCVALCMAASTVHAEPSAQLKPTDYVNDFAHVLAPGAVAKIDEVCKQIDEKAHAQIAVVTIKSLDGSDIESYAVDLFHQWGVGGKSTNRGVLILYAIDDHKARIEVGYGLEPILPDGKVGGFQREAVPLLRAGDYNRGVLLVTSRVADVIAQDAGVQLTTPQLAPAASEPRQHEAHPSLGGVILLLIVIVIVLFTPLRGILFWILFSNILGGGGRGGGGWGGGGFGGGGGGFGGFGGGSSGGGGASSGW